MVLWLDFHSHAAPRLFTHASTLKCSECSFYVVSGSPFLPLCVPAGVAVCSTALATTVQGAPLSRQGFALESAAARVCREAGARVTGFGVRGSGFGVWVHPPSARCEFVFPPQPPLVFLQSYYFECQGQQVISQLSTATPGVSVILKKETARGRLLLLRDIRHP